MILVNRPSTDPITLPGAQLCPGTVATIIISPENTLWLMVLIPQIKTVNGFPVAILVPQHNENLLKIVLLIPGKRRENKLLARTIPFHGLTLYCTWSPGTLGVMLHGRFVIIPRTVSTDSMGTEKWNIFRAIHWKYFQEQYKMMDGGLDCKSISNFVLLIPAMLNHQSSFLKISGKLPARTGLNWNLTKWEMFCDFWKFLDICSSVRNAFSSFWPSPIPQTLTESRIDFEWFQSFVLVSDLVIWDLWLLDWAKLGLTSPTWIPLQSSFHQLQHH